MKILLDECVPWPLHQWLTGHECQSVARRGWGGVKNGDLLRKAEGEFDLFITSDQNLSYQQNLANRKIAIIELSTNNIRHIEQAIEEIRAALVAVQSGDYRHVEIPIS